MGVCLWQPLAYLEDKVAQVRLTLVKSPQSMRYRIISNAEQDVRADERIKFSICGSSDTPEARRMFGEKLDSFLAMYGVSRESIGNFNDIADLVSPFSRS